MGMMHLHDLVIVISIGGTVPRRTDDNEMWGCLLFVLCVYRRTGVSLVCVCVYVCGLFVYDVFGARRD